MELLVVMKTCTRTRVKERLHVMLKFTLNESDVKKVSHRKFRIDGSGCYTIRLKPCLGPWRSLRGARQEVLRTDLILPQRQRDPLYKHVYDDLPPSRTSDLIMSTLPDRAHLCSCQRSAGPPGLSVSYSPYTEDALDRWCRDHESR